MSATLTPGTNYFSATCQIRTFLPAEGSYTYSIVIFPGQVQTLPSFNGSTEIRLPRQSPNHTCPQTVQEDSALACVCFTSDLGKPQGFIRWKESGSPELILDKVSRTLNGMTYTCSLMWNNTYVQTVTYTLSVHYPPTVVSFQINNGSKTVNVVENSSVPVVCGADGRPAPTVRLLRKYGGSQDTELMTIVSNTQTLQYDMNRVQCDTTGAYVCRSENDVGDNEQTIQLTVSCAPRENPANVHDSLTAEFTVEATLQFHMLAYPQPELLSIYYIGSFPNGTGPKTVVSVSLVQSSCSSQKLYIFTCTVTLRKKENFTFGFYNAVFGNTQGNHSFIFETSDSAAVPGKDLTGPVVGGVIGGIVLIAVVAGTVLFIKRKGNTRPLPPDNTNFGGRGSEDVYDRLQQGDVNSPSDYQTLSKRLETSKDITELEDRGNTSVYEVPVGIERHKNVTVTSTTQKDPTYQNAMCW